jgi:hypothetical protein
VELNQELARYQVTDSQSVRLDQHLLVDGRAERSSSTTRDAPGTCRERRDMRDRGPRGAGVYQQPHGYLISDSVGPGLQTAFVFWIRQYDQRDARHQPIITISRPPVHERGLSPERSLLGRLFAQLAG